MEQLDYKICKLEEKVKELSDEVSDLKSHFECEIENLKNEINEMRVEDIEFSDPEFIVKNAMRGTVR